MKNTIEEINKIALQGKIDREKTIKELSVISDDLSNAILTTVEVQ